MDGGGRLGLWWAHLTILQQNCTRHRTTIRTASLALTQLQMGRKSSKAAPSQAFTAGSNGAGPSSGTAQEQGADEITEQLSALGIAEAAQVRGSRGQLSPHQL